MHTLWGCRQKIREFGTADTQIVICDEAGPRRLLRLMHFCLIVLGQIIWITYLNRSPFHHFC